MTKAIDSLIESILTDLEFYDEGNPGLMRALGIRKHTDLQEDARRLLARCYYHKRREAATNG